MKVERVTIGCEANRHYLSQPVSNGNALECLSLFLIIIFFYYRRSAVVPKTENFIAVRLSLLVSTLCINFVMTFLKAP